MNVKIEDFPAFNVAYIRNVGPYNTIGSAFQKMGEWVKSANCCGPETLWLGAYHDCPKSTPPEKCRADACVTVPADFKADGVVQLQTIPAGRYASYLVGIRPEDAAVDFAKRWEELSAWVAKNSLQGDPARPGIEVYYNCAFACPIKKWVVDICIPIIG